MSTSGPYAFPRRISGATGEEREKSPLDARWPTEAPTESNVKSHRAAGAVNASLQPLSDIKATTQVIEHISS